MVSKRLKIVRVHPLFVVNMLNAFGKDKILQLPITEAIPDDVEVISVNEDWSERCLLVMISHPSFDEVPDGDQVPRIPGVCTEWRTVDLEELALKRACDRQIALGAIPAVITTKTPLTDDERANFIASIRRAGNGNLVMLPRSCSCSMHHDGPCGNAEIFVPPTLMDYPIVEAPVDPPPGDIVIVPPQSDESKFFFGRHSEELPPIIVADRKTMETMEI